VQWVAVEIGDPGILERAVHQDTSVRAEREDVRDHAAVRERFRRIAGRVDERLVEIRRPDGLEKARPAAASRDFIEHVDSFRSTPKS
jgi:hypothetical protein